MCQKTGHVNLGRSSQTIGQKWKADAGAGTIMALAIMGCCVMCLAMMQVVSAQFLQLARTRAAADAVAVAAADSLRGLSTGYPCEVAKIMSLKNGAVLDECRVVGFQVYIRLHSERFGLVLTAKARAGIEKND